MIELKDDDYSYLFCCVDIDYVKISVKDFGYALCIVSNDNLEILTYKDKKDFTKNFNIIKKGLEELWSKN